MSRLIYVNVDSPKLVFPYFNFLGGYQWRKKHPVSYCGNHDCSFYHIVRSECGNYDCSFYHVVIQSECDNYDLCVMVVIWSECGNYDCCFIMSFDQDMIRIMIAGKAGLPPRAVARSGPSRGGGVQQDLWRHWEGELNHLFYTFWDLKTYTKKGEQTHICHLSTHFET